MPEAEGVALAAGGGTGVGVRDAMRGAGGVTEGGVVGSGVAVAVARRVRVGVAVREGEGSAVSEGVWVGAALRVAVPVAVLLGAAVAALGRVCDGVREQTPVPVGRAVGEEDGVARRVAVKLQVGERVPVTVLWEQGTRGSCVRWGPQNGVDHGSRHLMDQGGGSTKAGRDTVWSGLCLRGRGLKVGFKSGGNTGIRAPPPKSPTHQTRILESGKMGGMGEMGK